MANEKLVLVTGASGHIGFRVLVLLLQHGYRARVALRYLSKADAIRYNTAIVALNVGPESLHFIEVHDMTVPGCFDEAVQGVHYICHVASPLATNANPDDTDFETSIIKPAVLGTKNMLEAAAKSPSVLRISITSSVFAFVPWQNMGVTESSDVFNAESRLPTPQHPPENRMAAYGHSKIAALNEAEAWVREQKPNFDIIHIHPNYTLGRNDLLTDFAEATRGTNNNVLSIALGDQTPPTSPRGRFAGGSVHVDDVARMHVLSLDKPKISGNQSFIANASCVWQDTTSIVAEEFPEAVMDGILPNNGIKATVPVQIDASKSEEVMGFKFLSFREQVVSAVCHYVELKKASLQRT